MIVAVYSVLIFDNSPNATVLLTTLVLLAFTALLGYGLGELLIYEIDRAARQIPNGVSEVERTEAEGEGLMAARQTQVKITEETPVQREAQPSPQSVGISLPPSRTNQLTYPSPGSFQMAPH